MNVRQPRYNQIFTDETKAETACSLWACVVEHLQDNDLVTSVRLKTADRYVRALTEYEFLSPVALEEGPTSKGPNGGDVFNFTWSAVEKLNDRIAKFEDALLISPKSVGLKVVDKPPEIKKTAADEFLED